MTLQELSAQFSPQFSKLIVDDRLENAIQLLMEKLREVPPGDNIAHWQNVRQQSEHLAGQLSKLNVEVRNGTISNDEKIRTRNQIRKNMQDLFLGLQHPEIKPPQSWQNEVTGTVKKWAPAVVRIYVAFLAAGLVLVIVAGILIYNLAFKPEINHAAAPGCTVETLAETALYKSPKINPKKWKTMPKGLTLAAETRASVKDKMSSDRSSFYEVEFEGKKGWVKIDGMIREGDGCYPQKKQEIPGSTAKVDTPKTPREICKESTTCCLVTSVMTRLHQSPNLFSETLIELPAGQILEKLGKQVYNHGGLSKTTFYKVSSEGYTGWVKHEDLQYVNPACVQ